MGHAHAHMMGNPGTVLAACSCLHALIVHCFTATNHCVCLLTQQLDQHTHTSHGWGSSVRAL
jgi:hypothetical protein